MYVCFFDNVNVWKKLFVLFNLVCSINNKNVDLFVFYNKYFINWILFMVYKIFIVGNK